MYNFLTSFLPELTNPFFLIYNNEKIKEEF